MRLKSYFPSPLEVLYFLIIQSKFWKDCVSALLSVPVRGSLFSHGAGCSGMDRICNFPSPLEVLYFLMSNCRQYCRNERNDLSVPVRGSLFSHPVPGTPDFSRVSGALCGANIFLLCFSSLVPSKTSKTPTK